MGDDKIRLIFFVLLLFVIIISIRGVFHELSDVKEQGDQVTVSTVELRSINYQSTVEGHFALGCGNLSGQAYYVCYQVLDDGGLKLVKFKTEQTVIYEASVPNGAYAEISTDGWGNTREVKLYVPQNTIQTEYNF